MVALVKDPDGEGTRDTSQEQTLIRFGHKWWIIGCGFSLQGHLPTMGVGGRGHCSPVSSLVGQTYVLLTTIFAYWFCF